MPKNNRLFDQQMIHHPFCQQSTSNRISTPRQGDRCCQIRTLRPIAIAPITIRIVPRHTNLSQYLSLLFSMMNPPIFSTNIVPYRRTGSVTMANITNSIMHFPDILPTANKSLKNKLHMISPAMQPPHMHHRSTFIGLLI